MSTKKYRVIFPIFPGFNTLDVNGPQEVLKNWAMGQEQKDQTFSICIAAASPTTTAFERVTIERNISFDDVKLSDYDIMLVPGGPSPAIQAVIDDKDTTYLKLINAFAALGDNDGKQRWLVSICTGAGLVATCGLFGGKTITTHFGYIKTLQGICDKASEKYRIPSTTVCRKRWVDAGYTDLGVKLVTSGGISCGIDCMLWVVSELADTGIAAADNVATTMDYNWTYSKIDVTTGWIV